VRRIWPKRAKIYWDPDYDIPIIKPRSEQVDLFYVLELTEPGDARPGFERDHSRLREAIVYEFNSDKLYDLFFRSKFILLNKVPHWDQMWEVVASGNVLIQLYYDPFIGRWRARLTYSGAYLGVQFGVLETIKIDTGLKKGMMLRSSTSVKQVVLVDKHERIIGLGENTGEYIVVKKIFKTRKHPVETSNRSSDIDLVIKHNRESIELLMEKSIKFLKTLREKYSLQPVVSYSGGKDSLVALDLTIKALDKPKMLFNDTGLELPETIENVEDVANYYDLELVTANAGNIFWNSLPVFGPPGRDYRWCCKVAKLTPIAKVTRAKWGTGALNIVGQRAFESIDRAKSPLIWRNKWVPHLLSTTPIQDWSQLAIWLYIYMYKLPVNPLYNLGFERLGCYLCPAGTLAEFKEIEEHYPQLWSRWISELEYWRIKLGQPVEWVKYGLWRWVTPAMAKYRLARKISGYRVNWVNEYKARLLTSRINLTPVDVLTSSDQLTVVFNRDLLEQSELHIFENNMKMLKYRVYVNGEDVIVETKNSTITIHGNRIVLKPYMNDDNFEDLVDVVKTIYRIKGCVKCGSCILWCPLKTIKFTENYPNPQGDCPSCRICIEICPILDVLVEKTVIPLIKGDPRTWKRSSRRRALYEYLLLGFMNP